MRIKKEFDVMNNSFLAGHKLIGPHKNIFIKCVGKRKTTIVILILINGYSVSFILHDQFRFAQFPIVGKIEWLWKIFRITFWSLSFNPLYNRVDFSLRH